jgi:hypothetical protein
LIQQILDEVGMLPQSKTKDKAAPSSTILCQDLDGETLGLSAVTICILSTEPTNKVSVDKMESERSAHIEVSSGFAQCSGWPGIGFWARGS